jgi:zinc protease
MSSSKAFVIVALVLSNAVLNHADVETLTTPAGHEFFYQSIPEASNVAIQIAWPSTWSMTVGRNPAVPFIATQLMLAGGTADMSASEVVERFGDLQASSNLIPTAEYVRGSLVVQAAQLDEALLIANSVIARPAFDTAWLTRTRTGFHRQVSQVNRSADKRAFDIARTAIIGAQPLRDTLSLQSEAVVLEVTRDEIVEYYNQTFVTSGAVIAVAGPISSERAAQAVDNLFSGLAIGDTSPSIHVQYDFSPRTYLLHDPAVERSFVSLVGRLPAIGSGGEFDDILAINLLGQGEKSELFDAVRTRLRASYGFNAGLVSYKQDLRVLVLFGEVETNRVAEVHDIVLETYGRFQQQGPTANVEDLLDALLSNVATSSTNPVIVSSSMLEFSFAGLQPNPIDLIPQQIASISAESLKTRISQLYPRASELITVIVSDDIDASPGACVLTSLQDITQCQ